MPNYVYHRHQLHLSGAHHLTKTLCEILARSLKDLSGKGGKSTKNS